MDLKRLLNLPLQQRLDFGLEIANELLEDEEFISTEERNELQLLINDLRSPQKVIEEEKYIYPTVVDKSILITGASSGSIAIGCAEHLLANGWKVYTTVRRPEEFKTNQEKGFIPFQLDYRDSDSIKNLVRSILVDNNGKLGALFNNGGYSQYGYLEDVPVEALNEIFETNVLGWIELTNLLLPTMLEQGYGRIIMHGSILGNIPLNYRGAYNATKSCIKIISNDYRHRYKKTGVGFSMIETGPVRSKIRFNSIEYYKKYIDEENSRFKDLYRTQISEFLNNPDQVNAYTEQPISVAARLLDAIESKSPQSRYLVTMPTYTFDGYKKSLTLDDCLAMSWLDSTE